LFVFEKIVFDFRRKLKQVQRENQLKVLCPKLVKTRQLSLGEFLERLIEIWPLVPYMETMTDKKGVFISKFLKYKRNDDKELVSVDYDEVSNSNWTNEENHHIWFFENSNWIQNLTPRKVIVSMKDL